MSQQPSVTQRSRVSGSDVAEELRQQIADGRLAPGDRIVQERVAAAVGGRRAQVREAIRLLEGEGLIEVTPNVGARVPALDRDAFQTIYKIRERLEPLALAESIPHLSEEVIDRLEYLAEAMVGASVGEETKLNREMHTLSYSGNPWPELTRMIERFWGSTQHYRRILLDRDDARIREIADAEHFLLVDAIRRRDTEHAEEILAAHIRRTRLTLMDRPDLFDET